MIQGIFYARFFPEEGTKIVAQSPPGCIVPEPNVSKSCLVDFNVLQEYIIPRKAFYNRYITVNDPGGRYTVLGFPVSIPHPKYCRNEFIFNFGLVVACENDQIPYEPVVRRLAETFAEMEKQNSFLSSSSDGGNGDGIGGGIGAGRPPDLTRRPIASLLEIIKEDLNNYGECMIPVDDASTINMKLFPHHAPPPEVRGWHVPVAKMRFADVVDPTWDLTLQRVMAHVDGVSDVRRIACRADVSLDLACLALRHLAYYDTVLLLDMFFFGACYAPRPSVHDFVANVGGILDECASYVCVGGGADGGDGLGYGRGKKVVNYGYRVSNYMLIKLMTTFCVGKSVMEWLKGHMDTGFDVLHFVDVRRLVQFGVIKGLLYRVHMYVVSKQYLAALATGQAYPVAGGDPLQRYTDGCHHFDQIITEQNMTEADIMERLKNMPPVGDLTRLYR